MTTTNTRRPTLASHPRRVFVEVSSRTDMQGNIWPEVINCGGRQYTIQGVKGWRPDYRREKGEYHGDCYKVIINGKETKLYFLRSNPRFDWRLGRWFVVENA